MSEKEDQETPEEFGRRLAQETDASEDAVLLRLLGAHTAMLCEIVRLLISTRVLDQTLVVSAFERLSQEMMQIGAREAVQVADIIRDSAAGEDRKPS